MKKRVFLIVLVPIFTAFPLAEAAVPEEAAVYEIVIDYIFTNESINKAMDVVATVYLFDNLSGWIEQEVLSESATLNGTVVQLDARESPDNRWAEVSIGDLNPYQSKTLRIAQLVKVESVEFSIDPARVGTEIPSELQKYTQPVPGLFESDDLRIQSLVAELTAGITNPYHKAKQIFDWIVDNIRYVRQVREHSALYAYEHRMGDCTEFSNLFVAMVRAAGLPAKVVSGAGFIPLYTIAGTTVDFEEIGHAWTIFYLPGYGWVPVDASWPQGVGSFGEIGYDRIAGATTGGEGVVRDGSIKWPGPGQVSIVWEHIEGKPASVAISTPGTLTPRVFLEVEVDASPRIQENGFLDFTVTIKNRGGAGASGLKLSLEASPDYFGTTIPSIQKSWLGSGEEWKVFLPLLVKENAYGENHEVTARVVYSSSFDGLSDNFVAVGGVKFSIPPRLPGVLVFDYLMLILLGALAAAIGALIGVMVRGS